MMSALIKVTDTMINLKRNTLKANALFYTVLCTGLIFTSPISIVHACDFHDQPSFGGFRSIGGFAQSHPLMKQHIAQANSPQLTLTHDRKLNASLAKPDSVDITYHLPVDFNDASLRFTHSDGVELETQGQVVIDQLNGTFTLNYVANKPGKHHIRVWADATKQTLPYSKVQRIELDVN